MYELGTYRTDDGVRQVLLLPLPSNRDKLALVDVPAGPGPLDYGEIHIVGRDIESLDAVGDIADAHLERSADLGRPATGADYLDDAVRIVSLQQSLRAAAR